MPHEPDDTEYYRDVLDELIELGTGMARQVQANAEAAAKSPAASSVDHTVAFERIAGAIRRTIALRRALDETRPAKDGVEAEVRGPRRIH